MRRDIAMVSEVGVMSEARVVMNGASRVVVDIVAMMRPCHGRAASGD
jgi:hypothetical protein